MRFQWSSIVVIAFGSFTDATTFGTNHGLSVKTTSGTVHGIVQNDTPHVRRFLGIPFAKAPVDKLRFSPPQRVQQPLKSVDAKSLPPACPQYKSSIPSLFNQDAPQFLINDKYGQSEDCLKLSIWAPTSHGARISKLPVFVFLYGGDFTSGGTDEPYLIPSNWVERTQEHLVVGVQYRVNIFGFPNAAQLDSQNLGLLDQRLALEWVRDNIAAFGGDTGRIILWGQSAGAASVDYLNFAYPQDPIASGHICDSGSVFLPSVVSDDTSQSSFSYVASHFNCTGKHELQCMRKISFTKIEAFLKSHQDSGSQPTITFTPVVDNKTVFSNYRQRYAQGKYSKVPAIFGTNKDEGEAIISYPDNPDQAPNQSLVKVITDVAFLCPAHKSAKLRLQGNRKTYRYYYEGNFTNISPRFWEGAYHTSELPLIFGTSGDFRGKNTHLEKATSKQMQDHWLAFAKNPQNPSGWFSFSTGKALVFGGGGKAMQVGDLTAIDLPCLG